MNKKFSVPIYGGWLFVRVCEDLQGAVDDMGLEFKARGFVALSHQRITKSGSRHYSILLTPKISKGCIAHESKHIVNMIFTHVDVRLDLQNDEAECYLLQWVFDTAESVFDEYNKLNADTLRT